MQSASAAFNSKPGQCGALAIPRSRQHSVSNANLPFAIAHRKNFGFHFACHITPPKLKASELPTDHRVVVFCTDDTPTVVAHQLGFTT
jgi:hypothetical protein